MFVSNLFFLEKGEGIWTLETQMRAQGHPRDPKVFLIGVALLGSTFIGASVVGLVFGVPLKGEQQSGVGLFAYLELCKQSVSALDEIWTTSSNALVGILRRFAP